MAHFLSQGEKVHLEIEEHRENANEVGLRRQCTTTV